MRNTMIAEIATRVRFSRSMMKKPVSYKKDDYGWRLTLEFEDCLGLALKTLKEK
jgi:hypothetical protein